MTPFQAPLEDILFCLKEVAGADRLPDWDHELAEGILSHFASFAEGVIAPLDEPGDAQGCALVEGRVTLPDGFKDAFAQLADGGWQGLTAPEAFGGMAQNAVIAAGVSEMFSGANHALQMVCNLVPGAISTLMKFGSEAQQQNWIPRLVSGEVLSTMCLTEPGAGSDLSRIRTKATREGDFWRIEGEKIFISGGDQDMSEGILHLVLARTGAPDEGIKGLSLFLCGSDIDGARNAVTVTRIEEKLGLHASPTCQLAFDGARAELIGPEGGGLMAMFTMMNHARLDVALQGVAHASRAHQIAATYAGERKQGRKPDGTEAVLADHPDVRRMLDTQKSLALGARAMTYVTMVELALGENRALVDFLTPICKVFCTEAGIMSADLGMQVLGGYGYLTEYRVSQTWRDVRITSIYEGANGIHAISTATRGLRAPEGPNAFAALVETLAGGDAACLALLSDWQEARETMRHETLEKSHDFMLLTSELLFQAVWCKLAATGDAELIRLSKRVARRPLPVRLPLAA
ncbi:MAG: acyl-CoA dehydrogenase family protein [Alphaproteobacteria bacterium]|nr:acyl-CoA dehydrogenase family protein [Alphaproteobacteria bacterium]MBU1574869.1 acyl-CoA dehydrogenase family protein [Alphaproteobacteria bacterium]MBU1830767.1 acyl-CoA dehydrogenase family protein [Alphaproteobacteria bacterium]MBU2080208.1 acyl-CoA dehydrogenase family protein [Alphaproteobacteria bacterium]MBU2162983.1 acyl-CoA dehydrogenase family protein [Alphaproteobacteria bacterium]